MVGHVLRGGHRGQVHRGHHLAKTVSLRRGVHRGESQDSHLPAAQQHPMREAVSGQDRGITVRQHLLQQQVHHPSRELPQATKVPHRSSGVSASQSGNADWKISPNP